MSKRIVREVVKGDHEEVSVGSQGRIDNRGTNSKKVNVLTGNSKKSDPPTVVEGRVSQKINSGLGSSLNRPPKGTM